MLSPSLSRKLSISLYRGKLYIKLSLPASFFFSLFLFLKGKNAARLSLLPTTGVFLMLALINILTCFQMSILSFASFRNKLFCFLFYITWLDENALDRPVIVIEKNGFFLYITFPRGQFFSETPPHTINFFTKKTSFRY